MPAKKETVYTPFAQLLERWMKAKPGFMQFSDFAEIVGLSPQIVSEIFTKGRIPSAASMRKIADNTREYDAEYYADGPFIFGQAGIPLADMLATRSANKPDMLSYLLGYVATANELSATERQKMLDVLGQAYEAYMDDKTLAERVAAPYAKAVNE